MSETDDGSSINASFGCVSGVVVDVTQSGAPPAAFDATHPVGRAGAVTLSKFSFNTVPAHGVALGVADAATVEVAVAVADAVGVGDA